MFSAVSDFAIGRVPSLQENKSSYVVLPPEFNIRRGIPTIK